MLWKSNFDEERIPSIVVSNESGIEPLHNSVSYVPGDFEEEKENTNQQEKDDDQSMHIDPSNCENFNLTDSVEVSLH